MALTGFRFASRRAPPEPPPRPAPAAVRAPAPESPTIVMPRVARTRPWTRVLALRDTLDDALARIARGAGDAPGALAALRDAGEALQRLCALDPDALAALPLRLDGGHYGTRHAMAAAVVLEFMLARRGAPAAERRTAVLAALTMNVGMHGLQETLWSHSGPLSPLQREGVLGHPRLGVALLRAAGVDDPLWLVIVAQHHEHLDGTGYPARLAGDAIVPEAQALMVAERWCAMVAPRAYRSGAPPDRALEVLLGRLGAEADPALGALLADTVGPTPPGTPVRLANGELGLVFRRTADPNAPLVRVFRSPIGAVLPEGVGRTTSEPRQRITGTVHLDALACPIDPERIWEAAEVVEAEPAGH
jgi:HD-GYP domain-containing protein (c-di-GMP phosphodiesterase class II)